MSTSYPRVTTGLPGLDHVLAGGLPAEHVYLVQGDPGAGKTTLALQYLLEGRRKGQRGLYVTLGETKAELSEVAESHGWSLDGIDVSELGEAGEGGKDSQYTLFHPSEIELGETTRRLMEAVASVKPQRLVFDSLSEMRLLARDPLRYRRQILALKQYFIGKRCTVLLLDDGTSEEGDLQLQSIAHGVIALDHLSPEYGAERRRVRIVKLRGVHFRGGYHDFTIEPEGVVVYPRLVAAEHREPAASETISTDSKELDALCGGGFERGSSTLILGPAGTGKSTLAVQIAIACARRGERSAIFGFDEAFATLRARTSGLEMPFAEFAAKDLIRFRQVDPAELAPSQFTNLVQAEVAAGARIVVIDSLNGYMNAMPDERFLVIQMHELLSYLSQQGVITIMTLAQQGLMGDRMVSPVDLSYLADSALLLRYYEARGEVHKAISMIKKRHGAHERTIREYRIGSGGLRVGNPLADFDGVLTGVPTFEAAHDGVRPMAEDDGVRG
jgi:circadian clock protein KaiC